MITLLLIAIVLAVSLATLDPDGSFVFAFLDEESIDETVSIP